MPRYKPVVQIVVASPSDVEAERNALKGVVEELNRGVAASRGLVLEVSRWEDDAYAGFHADGPQGLIDAILKIDQCDIFIGIFWKRFGTPVKDAKSGTEHEFKLAYEAWKNKGSPQIMFYFSQKPHAPKAKEETDQWGQVLVFKENFPKEGMWWPYENEDKFAGLIRQQLTRLILNSPLINYTQLPFHQDVTKPGTRPDGSEEETQRFENLKAAVNYLKKEFPSRSFGEILEMAHELVSSRQRATGREDEARTITRTIKLN